MLSTPALSGNQPNSEEQRRPTPMALFKLLPATNCRQCGQPTCWNFALKLAAAQVELAQCPSLFEPAYASQLEQLRVIVVPTPAIGSAG
jgi:ArsR family metal-binding transcriptional regulator